jgi:hypothetical protein
MMAAIGIAGLCLTLARVDEAPSVSIAIGAACIWYLAYRRFTEAMRERAAEGLTTSRSQGMRILVSSVLFASVVIGLPDAAFLGGYSGYMHYSRKRFHVWELINWPYDKIDEMMKGVVFGLLAALVVALFMRWMLWPTAHERGVRVRPPWPLAHDEHNPAQP